ncbi:Receptor-like protein kinase FERONIA [Acorus gramineus]|uniref:Receptor-like protein kinase FERONIA n=1 Tax=Acorus gramineus TaxID=55184 RepID=A0AAV9B7E6_ACOGR|nr:Receptor-like protein kinase FERONIA [Acorus gramineus]
MKIHLRNQTLLSLLLMLVTIITSIDPTSAHNSTTYVPAEKIFLNCGAPSGNMSSLNGLTWEGDEGLSYSLGIQSSTLSATASVQDPSVPTVPYMTARFFQTTFTYTFPVTPGRKFVPLHFYPTDYNNNFTISHSFFSVSVGSYTLLNNFSALLTTQAMNYNYIRKEFSVNISSNTLNLTFTPSPANKNAFAFVNGIEIVSTPQIFVQHDVFRQPLMVGTTITLTIDEHTAFETVARLNVGGSAVSARDDSGFYREWDDDSMYIYGAAVGVVYPKDPNVTIKYSDSTIPEYIAPPSVYGSARSMGPNASVNLNYNLTWIVTVDPGFYYLVRLHFCEIVYPITNFNMLVFNILINNMTAFQSFENGWGIDVPVYLDFIVYVSNTSINKNSSQDIWVALQPNTVNKPVYYDAELNGLEIFKINNSDGNLASPVFLSKQQTAEVAFSTFRKNHVQHFLAFKMGMPGVVLLILLLAFMAWKRWRQQKVILQSDDSSVPLPSNRGHLFNFSEIKSTTKDFSESLVIGVGGFGKVYRGEIDGGSTSVAIKRGSRLSNQGAHEFRTEIDMLSKLRHRHLNGMIDQIIDQNLKNDISPDSLEKFVEIAEKCLAGLGIGRPSMGDVLWNLEVALQMHINFEMGESSFNPTSISRYEGMTSSIVVNGDSVFSDLRSPKGR